MNGRCGNQFFQYAFFRKLANLNKTQDLFIDFYHVDRWRKKTGGDSTYSDQLKFFNVLPYLSEINNGNNVFKHGSKKQIKILKRYPFMRKLSWTFKRIFPLQRFQNRMQKNGIFKEDKCLIVPQRCKSKDIFIYGYFENPTHFDDIKEVLMEEFTPKFPRKEKNKKLYDVIDNTESVCVSFRVWHDLADDEEELLRRDVCTKTYYLKAIEKMHELHPNAHFIIFSNDVEWIKKNIKFNYPVSYEDGDDEIWEKLRMMYSCKHFIMSTSTFCWWAQYLCRNDNKTVISPNVWYADGSKSHLLMDDWIKINVK